MKKLLILMAVAACSLGLSAKSDSDTTVCFRVNPPMHCANCEGKIKSNLRFEKGIRAIEAAAPDSLVTIEFDTRKTNVEKIKAAFKKIGYTAAPALAKGSACKHGKECNSSTECAKESRNCTKASGDCCKAKKEAEAPSCCKK